MVKLKLTGTLCAIFMVAEAAFGGSAPIMKSRCNEDSLEPGPAQERIEWAAKCGHITGSEREYSLFDSGQLRARPLYPLYGKEDMSEIWRGAVDRNAPCSVPGGMTVIAFCTASCYTPEQTLLFPEGFLKIKEAKEDVMSHVMVLRDKSNWDDLKFLAFPVESYTEEVRPNWQDVLHFKTKSGGELRVTTNHPIVDMVGVVKTADKFKVGESLVHYLHGLDPIIGIEKERYFGKVYNLAPDTRSLVSNIVVAQGYLNGSSYFQNEGEEFQNRSLLRRTIPTDLLQ